MNELIYILRVILKRLPYESFLTGDKEAINLNKDLLSKEVHKYMSFHSDTETRNILESMEDFFRKYGEFFSDKKGMKGISVFDAIFLFSDKMLVIKNNEILVHYENILRWRMLVQDLGEEIFVTAFRAEQDLARGQECKNFDWPVVIGHNNTQLRNLTRRGMAENHFHLWGSAPYFYITWIWMMNHVDVIEKSNDFHRLDNDARTMYMVGGEEKYENSFKTANPFYLVLLHPFILHLIFGAFLSHFYFIPKPSATIFTILLSVSSEVFSEINFCNAALVLLPAIPSGVPQS